MSISRGWRASICLFSCMAVSNGAPASVGAKNLQLPLSFERQGSGAGERYIARGRGYMIAIEGARTTISTFAGADKTGSAVSMEFAGGRHVQPVAGPELPGRVNYIHGNDPLQWKLGLPTYERVTRRDVYPGVDIVYYGSGQQLEFDLVLKPGADPKSIRMKFDGARKVSLDAAGELVLETSSGNVRLPLPRLYQETGASKKTIEGHYTLRRRNEVGFEVASYDRAKSLVIDPTILFGALFGGNSTTTTSQGITLDSNGNIYLAGYTYAADFPTTSGAAQPGYDADTDGFVTKVNSNGTAVVYSTYLGGSSYDYLRGIAVDSNGATWVTGYTQSADFPVLNPYQGTLAGTQSAVLARLSPSGALLFSTYLGGSGSSYGYGVAVDSGNNVYMTGYENSPTSTGSFPTTSGVLFPSISGSHAFVAKFNSSTAIVYSTLLGGNSTEVGYAVAADSSGNAYVTGYTYSSAIFGNPGGGARTTNAGNGDAFVAKVNPSGTALLYFTFLGGSNYDVGYAIGLDSSSPPNAFVGGYTNSVDLNPTTGVIGQSLSGAYDGFVAKLNGTGSMFLYITYLGGTRADTLDSLAVEPSSGDVYVAGYTESVNFPVYSPVETFPSNPVALFQTVNTGSSWSAFDTNIPGVTNAISPDPVNSGVLVASTDTGIYRSTNNGSTWTSQSSVSTTGLSRSAGSPGTIYANSSGQIYLSTDNGVTWNHQGYIGTYTANIVADPLVSSTAYSFYPYTNSTIYKTTNSGMTWTALTGTGLPSGASIDAMVAAPNGTLYAALYSYGVYQSTNQAATWTAINTGLPSPLYLGQGNVLTVSPSGSGNVLYLSAGATVYKTTNGGANWAATAASLPNGAIYVASSPSNSNLVYATSYQSPMLYVSSNGGASWSAAATGLGIATITGVVFNPFNSAGAFALATVAPAAFVAKLNSTATALVYSTYLGGTGSTYAYGIATNGLGLALVTGEAYQFPIASTLPFSPTSNNGFVIAISDATAGCSYSVYPGSMTIPGYLQTITFGVNAPSGCPWTATTNQAWATVLSGASGTGAGIVTVQAATNGTSSTRSATLTVNTASATLTQAASSCSFSLNSYSTSLSSSGGLGQVNVTAPIGCPWVVVNNDPSAVTVTAGSSGSGDGTVNFTVLPSANMGSRTLSLTIAGNNFSITESGVCTFSLSSTSVNLPASSGTGMVGLTASGGGCPWTASSNVPWLAITAGSSGTGSGTVTYSIAANTGAPRSGTLTIGGQTFTVNQAAGSLVLDFNGDGKQDVFLYDPVAGTGYAGLSNGSGAFTYVYNAFTPGFDSIRYGNFTSGGLSGLVAYNSSSTLGYTLLGTGTGTFTPVSLFWGPGFTTVAAGDLNGDGLTDFVIYRPSDGTSYTAISNGDGTFHYQYTLVSIGFTHMVVADFNGDGKADVFFYRSTDGLAYLGIGNGTGGFTFSPVGLGPAYGFIEAGDINGDGKADLLLYASSSGTAAVGLSTGTGFTFTPYSYSPGFTTVKLFDFNGDGLADVAFYNMNNTLGYLGVGNGTGNFTFSSLFWGAGMTAVDALDLNGDGKVDIVIYNTTNGASYTGISSGNAANPFTYQYSYWGNGKVLATAAAQP
jgi:hypothetical protein